MKHDYAPQLNRPKIKPLEAVSWLVVALIIIVGLGLIMYFNIYLCSDVVAGKCI